jgi:hypothetical protein
MTNSDTQPASPPPPEPLDHASLIRAAADGELSNDDRQAFDSLCASDATTQNRVAFERALRSSTSRVMAEPTRAPQSVRAAVENIFDEELAAARSFQTRHRSFWSGRTAWASIAAAILLVAAVSIVTNLPFGGSLPRLGPPFASRFVNASTFVVSEHDRCSMFDDYFENKFTVRDQNDASSQAVDLLGASPVSLSLDQTGYEFAGSGKCAVPGGGVSMHVLYKPTAPDRPAMSVFLQKVTRPCPLEDGVRYRLRTDSGDPVLVWCDGDLIYYIFCPDTAVEQVAAQMLNAPDFEQDI